VYKKYAFFVILETSAFAFPIQYFSGLPKKRDNSLIRGRIGTEKLFLANN